MPVVKSVLVPLPITILPKVVNAAPALPDDLSAEIPVPPVAVVMVAVAKLYVKNKLDISRQITVLYTAFRLIKACKY